MEVVSPIVQAVVKALTGHITQKLRNLTSSADRVKEMKDKMKVLDGHRVDNEKKMIANRGNNKEVPARVEGWLKEVEDIKKEVEEIPSNDIGCFNVKKKYLAGRNALRLTEDIEGLIKESSDIIWSDAQIPLGRVDSKRPASTSTSGGNTQIVFKSRGKIFDDALKFLQHDDDKTRVVALCGMGGVGKTTLMKQLKEAAEDNKMFNWIAVVTVGKSSNLFAIQNAIAVHTGEPLTETDETLRAAYLSKRFKGFLERKEKSLVILDDVWEMIKLEDIGLASPLPNGVKLLLTSRNVQVCRQIADDPAFEEVKVDVLKENEAQDFLCQEAEISAEHDRDLYEIGCEIVKKCGCLPLAIKIIAAALKREKNRSVWRCTLKCLKNNDLDKNVQEIIEMSYNNLKQEEDKAIFLLCGLFPEDSNIPIEDLTRYAWGLKLLNKVHTIEDARDRTQRSVSNLKNVYLLMDGDSDDCECVKLHDIVLAFVVGTVSKGGEEGCWIIHHEDDFSNSSEANDKSLSCKQLSLTCKGMSEFPGEFQFPNLSLLKLMHGDESLRPQDFYAKMKKLKVIAFERMEYAFVPTSFQCSNNLRTLCLHKCSLTFDLACIGNLSNLEVLSFANSGITTIPSTFGNLKELRLLDVTGCYNLVIEDGVLKSLVKLEELYMIPSDKKACRFTDNNYSELAKHSNNLRALEFEFIGEKHAHMKNMSYEKLKRFKLSVGCSFTEVRNRLRTRQVDTHSYENSLKLITNREELELQKSMINELFRITDALYLQVNDMNTLPYSWFSNLRLLVVSECAELKYLFTRSVATNLSKLEYLEISSCDAMEAVIHTENNGSDIILFSNLKYLRLAGLRKLLCFCNNINVIELPRLMELQLVGLPNISSIYTDRATSFVSSNNISPTQSLLNKEDATPKLEKLFVEDCDSIEVLFNTDFGEIKQHSSSLRSIKVDGCNSLVKLFSCNPFPFFNNLQELDVRRCRSVQVLFEIDSGRAGRYEEQGAAPKLEKLVVSDMENLKEIWPPQFSVSNICPLRELTVEGCGSIKVLLNMDFGEIKQQLSSSLRSIKVSGCDSLVKLFSCNPFPFLNSLQDLNVKSCDSIQVLFDVDLGHAGKIEEQVCSSSLRSIEVGRCDSLVKLFSCNPFPFLNNLQVLNVESCRSIKVLFDIDSGRTSNIGEQVCTSSLRSIVVKECESLVNLLPRNPMPLFNHLEELEVRECASIEVIFDIDMGCFGETDKFSSSRLRSIYLEKLGKLREVWRIKDAGNNNLIHGFEAVESIRIGFCERFEKLITPATTKLDMRALKEVEINRCGRESERKNELVEKEKEISKIAFPSSLLPTFHNLHNLLLWGYEDVEVVFEITSPISRESAHNTQQPLIILPNLEELKLYGLEKMSHVWKCDWNEFLLLQKPQSQSSFHNLTTISMWRCNSIKYLFSPLIAKLLSNLKKVHIDTCYAIEVIVAEENGEQTTTSDVVVFPHLKSLSLVDLPNFVGFFLGKNEFIWPALEHVEIIRCPQITVFTYGQSTAPELKFINTSLGKHSVECGLNFHVTTTSHQARLPSYESTSSYRPTTMERLPWSYHNLIEGDIYYNPSGRQSLFTSDDMLQLQQLETVYFGRCRGIEEIFDSETDAEIPNLRQVELVFLRSLKYIWKSKQGTVLKFPNLTRLSIYRCESLEYVFTCPMVGSLLQLQELVIVDCKSMKVIVKGEEEEEECDAIVNASVVFPCLKSLKLDRLWSLKGFCIGKEAFEFPSLDTLQIYDCSKLRVFTKGDLSAPKLYTISKLGSKKYNIHNRLNSFIENFTKEE